MTELEKIEYAKFFIDKLANGINPLDDSLIPETELINNVRISRCFFYVSDILRQVIENGGITTPRTPTLKKKKFSLSDSERALLQPVSDNLTVSKIAARINSVIDNTTTEKISNQTISNENNDKPEGLYNFEVGDVIMVMENGIGTHAMIITRAPEDYRNEDEVLYLSGHTNFRMDESFRDILEDMNTNTVFRFYNFHDIKG